MHYMVVFFVWVFAAAAAADPDFWRHEWPKTDFSRTSIENWVEIESGGPPKDGIPALWDPKFVSVTRSRIPDREPLIVVELEGEAPRAYPVRYLLWHEIINDMIGDTPVAITYCPLCNSGMVFDRRIDDQVLEFGVTGKLRNSDMIMYDLQTHSWWQQATGRGIVGEMTDRRLTDLPAWMESMDSYMARNPEGMIMNRPARYGRQYGRNPYGGYDTLNRPLLFSGENPPHGIHPLARVVRVGDRAWPFERVEAAGALTEVGITITKTGTQASALDISTIANARSVAQIRVTDASGADIPHDVLFAFAFHAFWPDGRWMLGTTQ